MKARWTACRRKTRLRRVVAGLLGLATLAGRAAEPVETAEDRKAKCLYHVIDMTRWPTEALGDPGGPFVLGILGTDPWEGRLGPYLREQGLRRLKGRELVVTNCPGVAEASRCHAVFITKSERRRYAEILRELKDTKIFTVIEAERRTETDAVVLMYVKKELNEEHLYWMVNQVAEERAQFQIHSQFKRMPKVEVFRKAG